MRTEIYQPPHRSQQEGPRWLGEFFEPYLERALAKSPGAKVAVISNRWVPEFHPYSGGLKDANGRAGYWGGKFMEEWKRPEPAGYFNTAPGWARGPRGRQLLAAGVSGKLALGLEAPRRVRFLPVRFDARDWNDLQDACVMLGITPSMELQDWQLTAIFWLAEDWDRIDAERRLMRALEHVKPGLVGPDRVHIPAVHHIPSTKGSYALVPDDPTRRLTLFHLERSIGRKAVTSWRSQLGAVLGWAQDWAIDLAGMGDGITNDDAVITSYIASPVLVASNPCLDPTLVATQPHFTVPTEKGREWDRIDREGPRADLRWVDWKAWSFGWCVRHRGFTEQDLIMAMEEWVERTNGGTSNDLRDAWNGTVAQMRKWARFRTRQFYQALREGRVRWMGELKRRAVLSDRQRRRIAARCAKFGVSHLVEGLTRFAEEWLYARDPGVTIHCNAVWVPFAGGRRKYKEFRAAAIAVFSLEKRGTFERHVRAQPYVRHLELEERGVDGAPSSEALRWAWHNPTAPGNVVPIGEPVEPGFDPPLPALTPEQDAYYASLFARWRGDRAGEWSRNRARAGPL